MQIGRTLPITRRTLERASVGILDMADGGAGRAAHGRADRTADHGARDRAGGGLLFDGRAAPSQGQGSDGGEGCYSQSGHGVLQWLSLKHAESI